MSRGWNSLTYAFTARGVSSEGSTLMHTGSTGGVACGVHHHSCNVGEGAGPEEEARGCVARGAYEHSKLAGV